MIRFLDKKCSFHDLVALFAGFFVLFLLPVCIPTTYADITLPAGEIFYFQSVENPQEVEYVGQMTGQPRHNTGQTYFDTVYYAEIIGQDRQVRVSGPQSNFFTIDGGYAWNDNFGWISFRCDGGENLGFSCSSVTESHISGITLDANGDYIGTLGGNAWNDSIGVIDFSWRCVYSVCEYVEVNLTQGTMAGYAWNDAIGWMYIEAEFTPPVLNGACGDSEVQPEFGEQCDDGNTVSGDGCTAACQDEFCGDNVLQSGEQCDDGNTSDGDGCDATCNDEIPGAVCGNGSTEVGEACDGQANCTPLCNWNICGDGYLYSAVEQCDDGNLVNGDNCDSSCNIEPPAAICPNGVFEPNGADGIPGSYDDEECDDGNGSNNDSCLTSCQTAYCGDRFLNIGVEQCDDSNTINGDGCDSTCQYENPNTVPVCGNNIVEGSEQCDDGNTLSGDGCSAYCGDEGVCGDGYLNAYTEQCDDGNLYSGDGCDALCNDESPGAICSNGIVEPNSAYGGDEECDDGNLISGDGCSVQCKVETEWCGNAITDGFEECDDGNLDDTDVCKNNCTYGDYSVCGDSIETAGEECDDGNTLSGDGCNQFCQEEGGVDGPEEECENCASFNDCEDVVAFFSALFNTPLDSALICNEYCGNGYREGDPLDSYFEECDDGNLISGDGCSATCEDEIAGSVCGNFIEEIGEQCDDGNNVSGDGCDAFCDEETEIVIFDDNPTCDEMVDTLEALFNVDLELEGYCASGDPYCGDGTWNGYEECDWSDPNDDLAEYCSFSCEIQFEGICGDGYQDYGEACDDGNFQDGDGCDQFCEYEIATCDNDGVWEIGEECDTTAPPGFACTSSCELVGTATVCGVDSDGDGQDKDPGEECDEGILNGTPGSQCSATCQYVEPVEEITCAPWIEIEKASFTTYHLYANINCLEEPNDWTVSISNWDEYNNVYCDQTGVINPDSLSGCEAISKSDPDTVVPLGDQGEDLLVGIVSSQAPTGYPDPDGGVNLYVVESITLQIVDSSGALLYEEEIPIDYNMEFDPHVAPLDLNHPDANGDPRYYLDLDYNAPVDFDATVQISSPVRQFGAMYTLDIGYPYVFGFDVSGNGTVDLDGANPDAPDSVEYDITSQSYGGPNYSNTGDRTIGDAGDGFSVPVPPAYVVGWLGDVGGMIDESLDFVIKYRTVQNNWIYYPADSLPDIDDLRLYEYEAQIVGSVSADKSEGGGYTRVGNVRRDVARADILKNVHRLIQADDLSAAGTSIINFDANTLISGDGEFLEYVISDNGVTHTVYYFKDDVVIEGGIAQVLTNHENRTIVVDGGNVYVDKSVVNADDETFLELVVLDGNVYVGPDVNVLQANMFVDGSVFPYDGETKGNYVPSWQLLLTEDNLDNQMVFVGSLVSENTIGGSDIANSNGIFKGDGSYASAPEYAYIYDMNRFRRHGLVPGDTDNVGNPLDCDGDSVMELGPFSSVQEDPYCDSGESASLTSDMVPAGSRWADMDPDQNYGVYFFYRPPSNESPIFNSSTNLGVSE